MGRRLVPSDQEQRARGDQLFFAEDRPLFLHGDEAAQQIAGGGVPPLGDQLLKVLLEPDDAAPGVLFSLNENGTTAFERFSGEDRLAVAVDGKRLVFASNLRALRFLLQRLGTPAAAYEATKARWASEYARQPHAGSGWFDLARAARLMEEYLDLQAAILTMKNPADLDLRLRNLDRTRAAWDVAARLREISARVDSSSGGR